MRRQLPAIHPELIGLAQPALEIDLDSFRSTAQRAHPSLAGSFRKVKTSFERAA
jgi:hypothetical protein